MVERPTLPATIRFRIAHIAREAAGTIVRAGWDLACEAGAIGPGSRRARRFGSFGEGTVVCFPYAGHVNEAHIHLGAHTLVGPDVTLSAGWGPGHPNLPEAVVRIGDRCVIGRGSSVIGHRDIVIEDDVWTGYAVRIADMNHGYEDLSYPIAWQWQPESPVRIGAGSWLGHHTVVLPGATIGRHVTVGAASVVTGDLPDCSVAVGSPARVIRRWDPEAGWVRAAPVPPSWEAEAERAVGAAGERLGDIG